MKTRFLALLLLFSSALWAENEVTHYDRIHLSASASGRVDNDTIAATLFAQEEGNKTSALANKVNKRIHWAVNIARKNSKIKVQTQAYSTNPIYNKSKVSGWRVSQSIRLESKDMAAVSEILGQLQEKLGLRSLSFSVSPEQRNGAENGLISEALAAFETRAKIIAQDLRHTQYRIVDLRVSTAGEMPVYQARGGMRMEAMMSASVAPPALQAGESRLTISVDGEIELK